MNGYGQVYRTACPSGYPHGSHDFPYAMAFRGIIMDEDARFKEVWDGLPRGTPEEAFKDMERAAEKIGCTDLRPWSGTLPEPKV